MTKKAVIGSGLLIAGQPLLFTKELAVQIGVHNAVFLQQLFFMISRYGKEKDGEQWLRWSHDKWQTKVFPFWSDKTVRRMFYDAAEKGWLMVKQEPGSTPLYAIDYEVLHREYEGDRVAKKTTPGVVKTTTPQGGKNDHPQGGKIDHPVPHIERDTAQREKNQETSAPVKDRAAKNAELLSRVAARTAKAGKKEIDRIERRATVENVLLLWRKILPEYGFKRYSLSFTEAERGMVRNLIRMLANGTDDEAAIGKRCKRFVEFAVANWKMLRKKIVWETNGKPKLAEVPTMKEIFYSKEAILHYQEHQEEVQTADQKAKVFTDINQVPKTHPKFKQIAYMIENFGKAVMH